MDDFERREAVLAEIVELVEVQHRSRHFVERAVYQARVEGATWEDIAAALGITRQSAHQKFRHVTTTPVAGRADG